MNWIVAWLLNALALFIVAHFVPNIQLAGFPAALIAAVVIGLVNVLIKPILIILTLPITILTLGFFVLVINGVLFYAVGHLLQGFEVHTFLAGFIGALAYSIVSCLLTTILNKK